VLKEEIYYEKSKQRKANYFSHILHKKCLIKHFTEGKEEGACGRRRRRPIPDELKKKIIFWKLKNEAANQPL